MGRNKINILMVSNGYGEDTVASHLALALLRKSNLINIGAFPTVGSGSFYCKSGINVVGHGPDLPSEGFIRSLKDFIKDVASGFFRKTIKMGLQLGNVAGLYDYLIIVGDPYLLLFTSLFTKKDKTKKIFMGIQQSEWYGSKKPFKEHYSMIERVWMKFFTSLVFVRDIKTRDFLLEKGLKNVLSFGNPMMDCFNISKKRVFPEEYKIIGILPGSKKEAYENLKIIFDVVKILSTKMKKVIFAFALSPNIKLTKIVEMYNLKKSSKKLTLNIDKKDNITYSILTFEKPETILLFSHNMFGDIINESIAIIGLSGTANEQAAGMGKPVFSFWGRGPQITEKFLRAQKRLLGDSLFIFPPKPQVVADELLKVINDNKLLKKIENNGKMRMQGRGSIEKISDEIIKYIKK